MRRPRLALLILALGFASACSTGSRAGYPAHWWAAVPKEGAPSWEVLPQEAGPGEVVLSKRHELGVLSNFAPTSFKFHGKTYASVEGLWQSLKYPEGPGDARAKFPGLVWKYAREEVSRLVAFEAKAAGDSANENMKRMGINWVSFEGKQMTYRTPEKGDHYRLVVEALREKLKQNRSVQEALLATGDLKLLPDHPQDAATPPAWRYQDIWMELRRELKGRGP
jgi:predicted NAD-dependent protein-ADP-ribosyltransferase YbiA (DUF1768 family)